MTAFPKKKPKPRRTRQQMEAEHARDLLFSDLRSKGCTACGDHYQIEIDHIKTRGAGGGDEFENVWALCRRHHRIKHDKGLNWMAREYYYCYAALVWRGWKIDEVTKKWTKHL